MIRAGHSVRRSRRRGGRDGSAAVEFAIVGLPFFFMLFAILEIGMIFVIDSVLETAVIDTGRLVRTGQAANRGLTAATFKTELCSRMSIFSSGCAGKVTVDVREVPQFRNPNLTDPMSTGSFQTGGLTYVTGQPGSLVVVRAWYRQTLLTPFLNQGLSRLGDGAAMLTATAAFRNEPYNN